MDVLPFLLVFAGLLLVVLGFLGWIERLPRNGVAGVRTRSTMRSDATFRVANKAAGVPTMAAGGVALAGGVAVWLMPTGENLLTVVLVTTGGMLALVIAGGVAGVRATRTMTD